MTPLPLPSVAYLTGHQLGFGRAALIRRLRAERCNVAEISAWLHVEPAEVRRTLLRPVQRHYPQALAA